MWTYRLLEHPRNITDEEKKHLSYLGSMLRREPTTEEQEQQQILDWFVDNKDKFKDLIGLKED
jgi:hypothetical protein